MDFAEGVALWSDEACRIYGLNTDDNVHSFEEWLEFVHPDDKQYVLDGISASKKTLSETVLRHRIIRTDGSIRHVQGHTNFEFDLLGKPAGLYGVVRDVTDEVVSTLALAELNDRLQDRAEELAMSNAELEQFAYVASHDLQEPLRMVTGFITQLKHKYGAQLDERAHEYIHFAVDGAERMRTIILDLLEYARVGRGHYDVVKVDVNEMLTEVVMLTDNAIVESMASVDWDVLPTVNAVKSTLQQIFLNLISNAIKYRKEGVSPVIHISASENSEYWQFAVADNGIGIEPRYNDKIFIAFQRLHAKDEYSGSGIGLAICHQIVAKHRGKIWVESDGTNGSTFYFTINKAFTTSMLTH